MSRALLTPLTTRTGAVSIDCDDHVYVAFSGSPARVEKYTKDGELVGTWTGGAGQDNAHRVRIVGDCLLVTLRGTTPGTDPGQLVKIRDMRTAGVYVGSELDFKSVESDGIHAWVLTYTSPGKCLKIHLDSMTKVGEWEGDDYPEGIVRDGIGNLKFVIDKTPMEMVTVDEDTMVEAPTVFHNAAMDSALSLYSYSRIGGQIPVAAGQKITGFDFYMDKIGSPTGDATGVVRDASDAILGAFGTVDVSTLGSSPQKVEFRGEITVASAQDIKVGIEGTGWDASNFPRVFCKSSDVVSGCKLYYYAGSYPDDSNDIAGTVYPSGRYYSDHGPGLPHFHDGHVLIATYDDSEPPDPSLFVRVDENNMKAEQATLSVSRAVGMATCGDDILVSTDEAPGRIARVKNMAEWGVYTCPNGYSKLYDIASDGVFAFAAHYGGPPWLRKIIMRGLEAGT